MKVINPQSINAPVSKCFLEYLPDWQSTFGNENTINAFKYHLEYTAGLKLDFHPETRKGKFGYRLDGAEVVDEKKYTMWLLRWS